MFYFIVIIIYVCTFIWTEINSNMFCMFVLIDTYSTYTIIVFIKIFTYNNIMPFDCIYH